MKRARYEIIEDPEAPFYGAIPELPGVWVSAVRRWISGSGPGSSSCKAAIAPASRRGFGPVVSGERWVAAQSAPPTGSPRGLEL